MTSTRYHHPKPDPYPEDEDSVTDDLATARRWFDQDGAVVVNEEDGVSYLHTFGSLPIYGVESYQRNGGS